MKKRHIISIFLFICFFYCQGFILADPFEPLIPIEETAGVQDGYEFQEEEILPPAVVIEGVLWGKTTPQAIIDGEVYKIGDTLKNVDAKILKIENNIVFISHQGKVFEMETGKR